MLKFRFDRIKGYGVTGESNVTDNRETRIYEQKEELCPLIPVTEWSNFIAKFTISKDDYPCIYALSSPLLRGVQPEEIFFECVPFTVNRRKPKDKDIR